MSMLKLVTDNDVQIQYIPPNALLDNMDGLKPLLETVITPVTGHSVETVLGDLFSGFQQIFVIGDFKAIFVTQVQNRPLENVLWVHWMCGDDMPSWIHACIEAQEQIAAQCNCTAIEFNGRLGYKRMERFHGLYKPINTLYRREL